MVEKKGVRGLVLRAFAVDVDGTMTEDGGRLNLDAAFALRWLEKLGYRVILVSGRSVWEVFALAIYLGTTRVVVAENGGVVAVSPVDMAILADKSYGIMAYEKLSQEVEHIQIRRQAFPRFTEVILERNFDFNVGRRILEKSDLPVYLSDSKYAYHITHKDVNKAKGMKIALEYIKLKFDEVIAIGDSDTDIPLFENCMYSVALGNAPDTTKVKAKHVVHQGMGEGLVEAIQHVAEKFMKIS